MAGLGPTFWEDLLAFIEERRVIPVIGAELLRVGEGEAAVPLHAHIATRLAPRLGLELPGLPDDGALNRVIYLYLKGGGRREEIYPAVRAVMREEPIAVPRPLRQLAGIRDFTLFVTTTFDSLLEQALSEVRGPPAVQAIVYSPGSVEDLPLPLRKLTAPIVFHLLGRLSSNPDYVITEEDTLEFLYAMQGDKRPELLFDELRNNHLLLIGCSFPDWLARFFIRLAKGGRLSSQRDWQEVVADHATRKDPNLVLFLEQVSYRTKLFAEGDALQFVDELSRRYAERHPASPPGAAAPAATQSSNEEMRAGAIFLSYASEDRPTVERLHAGLTAAGLEVWFDQHGLEAGDLYHAKIRRQIRCCSYFLPVISANTQARLEGYFRMEWELAAERAMQFAKSAPFILPVTIDATTQAGAEAPDAFLDAQWARLPDGEVTPEFAARLVRLVRDYHKRQKGTA